MPLEFEILNFRFEIGFRLKGIAEDRTCLALELICTEFEGNFWQISVFTAISNFASTCLRRYTARINWARRSFFSFQCFHFWYTAWTSYVNENTSVGRFFCKYLESRFWILTKYSFPQFVADLVLSICSLSSHVVHVKYKNCRQYWKIWFLYRWKFKSIICPSALNKTKTLSLLNFGWGGHFGCGIYKRYLSLLI